MADNPELRIVITGEDATGKQAPAPQSGADTSKQAAPGPAPASERAALDASVLANLTALREVIARNDKTSKDAFETLKTLGSATSAVPGSDQYRALLESIVKGRLESPKASPSQPVPKLPETVRAPRLPSPGPDAASRQIIVVGRDQYTVDATQRGGAIGPPRPPDWQPPRLPSPGQPPARMPGGSGGAAGGGSGGMLPPRPPFVAPPFGGGGGPLPNPQVPQVPAPGGFGLPQVTMFLGALYFGTRIVAEFANSLRRVHDYLESEIQRYRQFNPQLAQAAALRDVQSVLRDMRRAQLLGPNLAKYTRQEGNTYQEFQDVIARLENHALPAITNFLKGLEQDLNGIEKVIDVFEKLSSGDLSAFSGVGESIGMWIGKMIVNEIASVPLLGPIAAKLNEWLDQSVDKNAQDRCEERGNSLAILSDLNWIQFPVGSRPPGGAQRFRQFAPQNPGIGGIPRAPGNRNMGGGFF